MDTFSFVSFALSPARSRLSVYAERLLISIAGVGIIFKICEAVLYLAVLIIAENISAPSSWYAVMGFLCA